MIILLRDILIKNKGIFLLVYKTTTALVVVGYSIWLCPLFPMEEYKLKVFVNIYLRRYLAEDKRKLARSETRWEVDTSLDLKYEFVVLTGIVMSL
jgi:hypothetical protein